MVIECWLLEFDPNGLVSHVKQCDLTSSFPFAMAPMELATIDLTTTSVRESMSSMVMMAGCTKMKAYKNPKLKKTTNRIWKQMTITNQNGNVIVTSDRKLNLGGARCGTDCARCRSGSSTPSTAIPLMHEMHQNHWTSKDGRVRCAALRLLV